MNKTFAVASFIVLYSRRRQKTIQRITDGYGMTAQGFYSAALTGMLFVVLCSINLCAQTRSAVDSSTPPGLALGMSGNNGNDFGSISSFNGKLNYTLPLLNVGGRGQAGYTMSLPVNYIRWGVSHTPGGQGEMWNTVGNWDTSFGKRYMPGILYGRQNSHENCYWPELYYSAQTRLTFVSPDGSEVDLISLTTGGGALSSNCYQAPPASRGGVFITEDGSGIKFVSDVEIRDSFVPQHIYPSGYLHFPNGTKYRINNGHVTQITDGNGNFTTFTYDATNFEGKLIGVTDSNGRNITITYGVQDAQYGLHDRITYPGFNGSTRSIRVSYGSMSGAMRAGETVQTMEQLFDVGNLTWNPLVDWTVVSSVWLTDDLRFRFYYNSYVEVARVETPTGAAFEYDHGASTLPSGRGGVCYANDGEICRQVLEKRVYPSGVIGSAYETKTTVARPIETYQHPEFKSSRMISTSDAQDNLLARQVHFFYSTPIPNISWGSFYTYDWKAGREYETHHIGSNGTLFRRELKQWTVLSGAFADARPSKKVSVILENGNALATLERATYDENVAPSHDYFSHLNTKRTKTYHFKPLDLNTAQTGSMDVIAALFSEGDVAAVSESDYLYDANYKARGILGLATETRVLNPINTSDVLAKSQFVYDETAYFDNNYTTTNWEDPNSTLRGNVTTSRTWNKDTNTWIESNTMVDNFGNVRKVWDTSGDSTRFVESEYDPVYKYAYSTKVISPAPDPTNTHGTQQKTEIRTTYDFAAGLPLTVTDAKDLTTNADDQTTTTEYNDPLLRPTKVIPADGAGIVEIEYVNQPGNFYVKTRKQITANNWNESVSFMDGVGRIIQTQAKDAQRTIFTDTEFDKMGRVKRTTKPYLSGENKKWVETIYDSSGRTVELISPIVAGENQAARILSEYNLATSGAEIGTVVISTNQSGKKARSISNVLGQLVRFDEPNAQGELGPISAPSQPTYYTYDHLGKLRKVTQEQQSRFFMYDGIGRLKRVKQPEQDINPNLSVLDPVTGNSQWNSAFSYDLLGNLISSTDAKGAVINYSYDNLNRLIARSYSIPQTTDPKKITYQTENVSFRYDGHLSPLPNGQPLYAGMFAKGQLTEVNNGVSITQNTSFDNQGRVTTNHQIIDGHVFPFEYTYNLGGKLIEQTYPSGRKVTSNYDESGDLESVVSNPANQLGRYYARNFQHNANGDIVQVQLGNGRWEHYQYNARNQITQLGIGTSVGISNLWKVAYDYGQLNPQGQLDLSKNDGNISRQTITVPGLPNPFVQSYAYDTINRLSEAKETISSEQTWRQSFQYDRYGNRIGFSEEIGQTVTPLNNINHPTIDPTNNRFISSQGYEYDHAGNLIQDAENRMFVFDAENKQRIVSDLSSNILATYVYDANGRRVKKTVNANQESTIFVYDAFGKLVAEYSNILSPTPKTSYLTNDIINSVRVITDELGQVVSRRDFMPFGEELYEDTPHRSIGQKYGFGDGIRKRFAGYERDSETDLDFAEARYYNGKHGRFTAVDPLTASGRSSNPQTFNRYLYAGNNPVRRIDPNGTDWCVSYGVTRMQSGYGGEGRPYTEYNWATRCTTKSPPVRSHVVFINSYTDGTQLGKYVALDPFTRDFKPVNSVSEAQSEVQQYRMQAALDFIVGFAEANSLVLELSGASDYVARTGGDADSPYQIGRRAGEGFGYVSMGFGGTAAASQLIKLAGRYGLGGLKKQIRQLFARGARLCCFAAGTPIHTDKGLVPIEKIKVGDKVLSWNERTKQFEYKAVLNTFVGTKQNLVKLRIRGENKTITTSSEHPFYISTPNQDKEGLTEGRWIESGDLQIGDKVLRSDGIWSDIIRIESELTPITVYNFEVEGNQNYFVGFEGLLVHNSCLPNTIGGQIAGGHSFVKHFLEKADLSTTGTGFRTLRQWADHIDGVIRNATGNNVRQLANGRTAYWDDEMGIVIIRNPRDPDGGTAFRPKNGRAYFDNLR